MEQRLTDVEIHVMHLERMVQELNELVTDQQVTISLLRGEMQTMKEQMKQLLPSLNRLPEEEDPPPHY